MRTGSRSTTGKPTVFSRATDPVQPRISGAGETFVSRKITRALTRISLGLEDCLYLGNLEARRDWGHAREYVEAQWLMLQQEKPEDFVIATGEQHSVREFVVAAAKELGMDLSWKEGDATSADTTRRGAASWQSIRVTSVRPR